MSTERKIQDYLHFYLGCDCQIAVFVPGQELSWEPDKINIRWLHGALNKLVEVKPILRNLSDMTEEEAIELVKLSQWRSYGPHPHERVYSTYRNSHNKIVVQWGPDEDMKSKNVPTSKEIFTPDEFAYLLSKGFDLFELIKDSLAINKTTLKP